MEADMWARRVLFATMIAAAAMSLPRHVPASGGASAFQGLMVTAQR
jgi:hypothetical protein